MGVALVIQQVMHSRQIADVDAVLATEVDVYKLPSYSNKTEHFGYKGEWVNV